MGMTEKEQSYQLFLHTVGHVGCIFSAVMHLTCFAKHNFFFLLLCLMHAISGASCKTSFKLESCLRNAPCFH